jgi:hypothetical protein
MVKIWNVACIIVQRSSSRVYGMETLELGEIFLYINFHKLLEYKFKWGTFVLFK